MLKMMFVRIGYGAHFAIENSYPSLVWFAPALRGMIDRGISSRCGFVMCCHGLRSPAFGK